MPISSLRRNPHLDRRRTRPRTGVDNVRGVRAAGTMSIRRRIVSVLASVVIAGPLPATVSDVVAGKVALRIMPLGDSITQGYRDSYRRPLWLALTRAGIDADFVGSMNRGYGKESLDEDFDRDHEGHWGWRADQVLAHIDKWAVQARPDIVLMHLGTNDIGVGQDIDHTAEEIARIIQSLRHHNSGIHILLAAIIPMDHNRVTRRIERFNAALAALASAIDTPGSRVVLVDQFSGFDAERDTYDGTHPNQTGNNKIADKWFVAIKTLLQQAGERPSTNSKLPPLASTAAKQPSFPSRLVRPFCFATTTRHGHRRLWSMRSA